VPLYSTVTNIFQAWTYCNGHYYSFKIFPRFWLVKTTHIIHHKQLLLTKKSVILNQWRQKCGRLQIIKPLTSKWRPKCSSLQIIESLTSKIIEPLTEKTWAQGCVIQQRLREMAASRVYKFERRKYFEWIIRQLLNLAFIGYEEFCRSQRVLSNTHLDLQNSSYPTQPHSIIANYSSFFLCRSLCRDVRC